RATAFEFVAATGWTDPAQDQARADAVRSLAAVLTPFASGMYANIVNDEGLSALRRTYSNPKLTRLTTLKNTYDPENTFRLNHNIPPTTP
ncbi:MAG TPA: BBE domain-containing protein, partial [Streptosporangiaceae bacterium]|nr:BBE domain-containing protein [Streptosporangiaceae bacterium]